MTDIVVATYCSMDDLAMPDAIISPALIINGNRDSWEPFIGTPGA
jgi:hypothetical protein